MWPTPLPFTLSQAALLCLQASLMPNGNRIEALWLKDLKDLQEKELPKKYWLTSPRRTSSGSCTASVMSAHS